MRWSLVLLAGALSSAGCTDDGDDTANACPGAGDEDICDGEDNDCDGEVDEDAPALSWYQDADGDGYGDEAAVQQSCAQPDGTVDNALDCDDDDADVSPDAEEVCGGTDEDCDGVEDDDDPSVSGQSAWYLDQDGDGLGAGTRFRFCEVPDGYVDNDDDCDDDDPDSALPTDWYLDADGDGYGSDELDTACEQPDGYVDNALDCDDEASAVNPGEREVCFDDLDNDCDELATGCLPIEGSVALSEAGGTVTSSLRNFGSTLRSADTDGDGALELYTSSYVAEGSVGALYGYDGLAPGSASSDGAASRVLYGDSTYSYLGYGFGVAGDLDEDGYEDLAAWSYTSYMVVLIDGPVEEADSVARVTTTLTGPENVPGPSREWLQGADLDDDGTASLLVGCYACTDTATYEGAVYLISEDVTEGKNAMADVAELTITGGSASSYLGMELDVLGDLDGDGVQEFAAGAYAHSHFYTYAGSVGVFSGGTLGTITLTEADLLIWGTADYQYAGTDVSAAGDVDGDGDDDLILSAIEETRITGASAGAVYVFLTPLGAGAVGTSTADAVLYSTNASYRFGDQIDDAGDLNGDAIGDLVVGDYTENSYTGGVYVYYGPISSGYHADTDADAHVVGAYTYNYIGYELAGVGDLDADGYDDLAINDYASQSFAVFFGGAF